MDYELAVVAVVAWMLVQLPDGHRDEGSRLALTATPARMCRVIFHPFSHHRKRIGRWPVVSIAAVNGRRRRHGRHAGWQPYHERTSERGLVSAAAAAVTASRRGCSRSSGRPCTPHLARLHRLVAAFSSATPRLAGGFCKRGEGACRRPRLASCVSVHAALRRKVLCACATSEAIRTLSTYGGFGPGVCPFITV